MSKSQQLVKGTVVLLVGRVSGYALSFLRNLILARVLAKADYGLAAVFAMAMTLLEISGNMAFGTQVIQSKHGDTAEFQASAQALMFVGGLCSAVLLVGISVPMARIFNVPNDWWGFALLAIVPLSQGLNHLDIMRRQRELEYLPLILVDVVPQFIITAAVWPLALWLKDFRVILFLMVGKAVISCAMTFMFARRRYEWAWERTHIRGMLKFGWPLLVTGLVMYASGQADQMIVGSAFSLSVLASYALAATVVSIPWFIFSQVGSSLMLPLLSRVQEDPEKLRPQYRTCIQTAAVCGTLCLLPLVVGGEQIVRIVFGAKYQGTGVFVAILGAATAIRFLRHTTGLAGVARADTLNTLYSNLWRATSLPVALIVVSTGGSPNQIAACAIVGELLAAIASAIRISKRGVPLCDNYRASAYLLTLLILGLGFVLAGGDTLPLWPAVAVSGGALCISSAIAWFLFPEIPDFILTAFRNRSGPKIQAQ